MASPGTEDLTPSSPAAWFLLPFSARLVLLPEPGGTLRLRLGIRARLAVAAAPEYLSTTGRIPSSGFSRRVPAGWGEKPPKWAASGRCW